MQASHGGTIFPMKADAGQSLTISNLHRSCVCGHSHWLFTSVRRLTETCDVRVFTCNVSVFWIFMDIQFLWLIDTGHAKWIPVFSNNGNCVWRTLYGNVHRSTVRHFARVRFLSFFHRGFECLSSVWLYVDGNFCIMSINLWMDVPSMEQSSLLRTVITSVLMEFHWNVTMYFRGKLL